VRTYPCACGNEIYFINSRCLDCGREVGYLREENAMVAFERAADGAFVAKGPKAEGELLKKCRNYAEHDVCNWMIPDSAGENYCAACRLNKIIPNLQVPKNKEYWYRLEKEKRRLLYGLDRLGLPFPSKKEDEKNGLAFAFMADHPDKNTYLETLGGGDRVYTGHAKGLITINVAEADDVSRELMRVRMDEPYRTLLGHFRHEVGHFYWDRLVKESPRRSEFDRIFGSPLGDYGAALKKHYASGARPDWREKYISSYAAAHPWEDWAETWAHFMHMVATMETAHYHGLLDLDPGGPPIFSGLSTSDLVDRWSKFAVAFNGVNISMGYHYLYPFVLNAVTYEKLAFVRDTIYGANQIS
jgi:hypothetical protein